MFSRRAYALAGLIVLMIVWGSMFVVTKAAVREIPPLTLAALRFLIATVVLVPLAAWRGGLARLPKPLPVAMLALMGLAGIAMFTVAFNYALAYGSATQGALIYTLLPAAVSIAAATFLRESLSGRRITGIGLSFAGAVLVVAAGGPASAAPHRLLGATCMLGAIAAWAAYTVLAKRLAHADQVVVIACVTVGGTIVLVPLAAIELLRVPFPDPSLEAWFETVFLGVVASGIAYVAYSFILRELDASLVGAYTNLDPIVGVLTAVLFLGEKLYPGQMLGGAIAIWGMWLASNDARVDS